MKVLLPLCFFAVVLLVAACSLLTPQPDDSLHMVQPVAFTMESYDGKELVPMQVVPGREAELEGHILRLEAIERKAQRERQPGEMPVIMPSYGYKLVCTLREGEGEPETCRFDVRASTWIGGNTVYAFDARSYFTPESWAEVRRRLYDEDCDGYYDERYFSDYEGSPLPAAESSTND